MPKLTTPMKIEVIEKNHDVLMFPALRYAIALDYNKDPKEYSALSSSLNVITTCALCMVIHRESNAALRHTLRALRKEQVDVGTIVFIDAVLQAINPVARMNHKIMQMKMIDGDTRRQLRERGEMPHWLERNNG